MKKRILFLCTGNSCRSQMAEGWARHFHSDWLEAYSAGVEKHGMNQNAILVMKEAGLDISSHSSKLLSELPDLSFDLIVTVCDNANERCPIFPGKTRIVHVPFEDPPALAREINNPKKALDCYRKVRDQIKNFVEIKLKGLFEMKNLKITEVRKNVAKTYGSIARNGGSCCGPSAGCCTEISANPSISRKMGYSEEELNSVPEGANLGLGCGNPQTIAGLKSGETVLDLGSGGGFDCFLAAGRVGETGQVIGVDMTPEMIAKARENAANAGLKNVEFRLGEIEHLPVADNSVDVIISNCVVNLSPEKAQVFAEAYRVLKNGGRIAISDVVALQPLPEVMLNSKEALCSCVSGAVSVEELEKTILAAGFSEVAIEVKPESRELIRTWFPEAEKYVCSASIRATK